MDIAFNAAIGQFAKRAVQMAGAGMTAEDFAEAAQQQIPQAYDEKIFALVSADDWFDKIFASTPGAENHRAWLTELRDIFVEDFGPDEEEEKK